LVLSVVPVLAEVMIIRILNKLILVT
jgi:hypothetical protein